MATAVKQKKEVKVVNNDTKSKQLIVKKATNAKNENKNEKTAKTDLVVNKNVAKKEAPKKKNEVDQEKAIKKYKDVPLGELYQELGGMRNYIDILEQRKKELLQAKAILDKNKRKIAIKKTIEDTDDFKFKYQEATFRLHNIPTTTKLDIVNQNKDESEASRSTETNINRVMQHSEQRDISSSQPTKIERQEFIRRVPNEQPKEINLSGQMQKSELRNVAQNPQQSMGLGGKEQLGQKPFGQQQSQVIQNINNNVMIQQQGAQQPFGQPVPQQQPTPGAQPMPMPQPSPKADGELNVKPLYDKIHQIIGKNSAKDLKVLYALIITSGVLLSLGGTFLLLWGFASNWGFNISNFIENFKNFFTF